MLAIVLSKYLHTFKGINSLSWFGFVLLRLLQEECSGIIYLKGSSYLGWKYSAPSHRRMHAIEVEFYPKWVRTTPVQFKPFSEKLPSWASCSWQHSSPGMLPLCSLNPSENHAKQRRKMHSSILFPPKYRSYLCELLTVMDCGLK